MKLRIVPEPELITPRLRFHNSFRPNSHRPVTIRQMANAKPKAMLTIKPNGFTNRTTMTKAKTLATKM
jgi:hypothetical protein